LQCGSVALELQLVSERLASRPRYFQTITDFLCFAKCSRNLLRNRLILLLSVRTGFRAAEIAKLTWDLVLDPSGGGVGLTIGLQDRIAKKRGGQSIPLHHDLREALMAFRGDYRETDR